MHRISIRRLLVIGLLLAMPSLTAAAGEGIDKSRYITVDEVHPDMEAYCLTVYQGTEVEKFPLKILSVIPQWLPGMDGILVIGTDERFKHTGAVHGCSGSPVYIDGRMAGALAFGWDGSKDPLYVVTPIEHMLKIGSGSVFPEVIRAGAPADLSDAAVLRKAAEQLRTRVAQMRQQNGKAFGTMDMPLYTSLPASSVSALESTLGTMGFSVLSAGASGAGSSDTTKFEPGGVFTVPLMVGDITLSVGGTVTEVDGKTVYGFGHQFMGIGPLELPIAAGTVHTVVSGVLRSNKYITPGPVTGTLHFDEYCGIVGEVGAEPEMIPVTVKVERYNDPETRVYNCRMASNELYSPLVLQSAIVGAITMRGPLPPEHTLKYKASVAIEGFEPVDFENISTASSYGEIADETVGLLSLIMENRFKKARVESISVEVDVQNTDRLAFIKAARVSDDTLKAGETIGVDVLLQSYMLEQTWKRMELTVPENLRPGKYELQIGGAAEYEKFLRQRAPQQYTAYDLPTMMKAIRNLVETRRDRLYMMLPLPQGGIAYEQKELDHLPSTRAMLLQDGKRMVTMRPLQHWVSEQTPTDCVVMGGRSIQITVEE